MLPLWTSFPTRRKFSSPKLRMCDTILSQCTSQRYNMETIKLRTGENTGKSRVETIVRIDALVAFGVSVTEACRREKFPRPSYYRAKSRTSQKENPPSPEPAAGDTTKNTGDSATQSPSSASVAHASPDQNTPEV